MEAALAGTPSLRQLRLRRDLRRLCRVATAFATRRAAVRTRAKRREWDTVALLELTQLLRRAVVERPRTTTTVLLPGAPFGGDDEDDDDLPSALSLL